MILNQLRTGTAPPPFDNNFRAWSAQHVRTAIQARWRMKLLEAFDSTKVGFGIEVLRKYIYLASLERSGY